MKLKVRYEEYSGDCETCGFWSGYDLNITDAETGAEVLHLRDNNHLGEGSEPDGARVSVMLLKALGHEVTFSQNIE